MTVFVDTSALYAVFDRDDANHEAAKEVWAQLLRASATLFTSNYVLVETTALLQRRLGLAAVRRFHEDVMPVLAGGLGHRRGPPGRSRRGPGRVAQEAEPGGLRKFPDHASSRHPHRVLLRRALPRAGVPEGALRPPVKVVPVVGLIHGCSRSRARLGNCRGLISRAGLAES